MSEIDYDNYYLATADESDIVVLGKASQKDAWYNKELLTTVRSQKDSSQASSTEVESLKPSARLAKTSAMEETKMANGVTIFNNSKIAAPFSRLVRAYL